MKHKFADIYITIEWFQFLVQLERNFKKESDLQIGKYNFLLF